MEIVSKDEFLAKKELFEKKIRDGKIFIHPTDTIYGIGCNALDEMAVNKVRLMKQRNSMPFSILVPSKEWIYEHSDISDEAKEWVEKLPGPYTLVIKLKDNNIIPDAVNPGVETLGVRIPDHWFSKIIEEVNVPIITTSANITGQQFMTQMDELDMSIKEKCDFAIYEGEKRGRPSTVVKLYKEEIELFHR